MSECAKKASSGMLDGIEALMKASASGEDQAREQPG